MDSALFTAKEAAVGFAIGATVGFLLGALIARFGVLQRGVMPYVVASQTIPILAIAPIVVAGLGSLTIFEWTPTDWMRVSVIAAYLTFFPVTAEAAAPNDLSWEEIHQAISIGIVDCLISARMGTAWQRSSWSRTCASRARRK